jgi:hypothetical protein
MNIKPAQRVRLVKSIRYVLEHTEILNNSTLPGDSARRFEQVLSALDPTDQEAIRNFISDAPMTEFIYHFMLPKLRHLERVVDVKVPLSSIPGFTDLDALADEIATAIGTLPWSYKFAVQLPQGITARLPRDFVWDLGDDVSIARGNGIAGRFQYPNLLGNNLREELTVFPSDGQPRAHLLVGVKGLVDIWQGTRPFFLGLDRAKAIYGLMMALGLVNHVFDWERELEYVKVHVFRGEAGAPLHFVGSATFGRALSETINGLLAGNGTDTSSREAWGRTIGGHLNAIRRVLNADEATRDRLLLGAQWFFESYGGDNQLLCFIQTMVCLEILVGEELKTDQPRLGISELIRNRVAYLIGKDMAERNHILDKFGSIYKVRSEIVHRGHSRLTAEQRGYHATLRDYCARVLRAEMELLRAANDPADDHWLNNVLGELGADPMEGMFDGKFMEQLLGSKWRGPS